MSGAPWLSVVIPVEGQAQGLEATLDSLAAWSGPGPAARAVEVLVVAQGHAPLANQAVRRAREGGLAVLLLSSPRPGPGEARNMGLGRAQGEVVLFTGPGCLLPLDMPARLAEAFAEPGVCAAGGGVLARDADSPLARATAVELGYDPALARVKAPQEDEDEPRTGPAPCPLLASAAFRRSALMAVGGFPDPLPGPLERDRALCARLAESGGRMAFDPGLAARAPLPATWGQVWHFYFEEGRSRYAALRMGRALPPGAHLQPSLVLLALGCLVALWPLDPARAATLALVALLLLYPTNRALLRHMAEVEPGLVRWGLGTCLIRPTAWLAGMAAAALGRVGGGGDAHPGGGH